MTTIILTPTSPQLILTIGTFRAGSGDVTGPASSVDETIARFDGVTGKLIQGSGPTINDAGEVVAA